MHSLPRRVGRQKSSIDLAAEDALSSKPNQETLLHKAGGIEHQYDLVLPYRQRQALDHPLRDVVLEGLELHLSHHMLHQRPQAPRHQVDEPVSVLHAHRVEVFSLRALQYRLCPPDSRDSTIRSRQSHERNTVINGSCLRLGPA